MIRRALRNIWETPDDPLVLCGTALIVVGTFQVIVGALTIAGVIG